MIYQEKTEDVATNLEAGDVVQINERRAGN
jgi:hypothetical protein